MAVILTAQVLGWRMGLARAICAVVLSIGVGLAIAVAGFWSVGKAFAKARRKGENGEQVKLAIDVPPGRGDIRPWLVAAVYVFTTSLYVGVSTWLLYLAGIVCTLGALEHFAILVLLPEWKPNIHGGLAEVLRMRRESKQ